MSGYDGEDSGQQGFALIVVLWAVILLGTIAAAMTQTARTEIRVARNVLDQAKAEALADGAVHRAILALRNPDAAERWPTDGSVRHFTLGEGESFITIEDEGGKVDLNGADEQLMAMLLRGLGLDAAGANALVDAIVDYRDEDDLRRLNGAEAGDYAGAGLAWRPRNGPFEDVGELKRVLGMETSLFERLAPLVTVYTYQRGIDPEVAPLALRTALGEPAGEADGTFSFAVRSQRRVFTIRAEAHMPGGAVFVREAVVRILRDPKPFAIHAWRQGQR